MPDVSDRIEYHTCQSLHLSIPELAGSSCKLVIKPPDSSVLFFFNQV